MGGFWISAARCERRCEDRKIHQILRSAHFFSRFSPYESPWEPLRRKACTREYNSMRLAVACSRRSDSGARAKKSGKKTRGDWGPKSPLVFFPPFRSLYFSLSLHYLNAWNKLDLLQLFRQIAQTILATCMVLHSAPLQ